MEDKDYKNLCELCIPLVRSVGDYINEELGRVTDDQIEAKEKNSLVSYVDKTAEQMLVTGLSAILPDAGFVTEEGTVEQGGSEVLWIVDPLDGTSNFLHGIPHFAVSVGLEVNQELSVGIVLDVMREECFYAWRGGGAYCNEQEIRPSATAEIGQAIIGTGFPYRKEDVAPLMSALGQILKEGRGIRRLGAAALDLCYVASGRLDAYYESTLSPWDIAGGALILKEAGGKISDFFGAENYLYEGQVLAANPQVYKEVQVILEESFK